MPDLTACLQTATAKQAASPQSPSPAFPCTAAFVSRGRGESSLLTLLIGPAGGMQQLGWDTRALWLRLHRHAGRVRLPQTWFKSSGYIWTRSW